MSKEIALNIKETATRLGWDLEVRGSILTITKRIRGKEEFVTADMEYYSILGLLPTTSAGSIWGTDGGGIGAVSAMNTGLFKMNKSGGSKRVLTALAKL
jgi:hypothetical protein